MSIANSWPLVVGTVYSPDSLRAAAALGGDGEVGDGPDLLELRVDHFAGDLGGLEILTVAPPRLFIVTVRRRDEGGAVDLSDGERETLFARFLPVARLVDIEVRSLWRLGAVVRQARAAGCAVVASFHDFEGTPGLDRLREQAGRALDGGAHVLKVAATTHTAADLATLLEFSTAETRLPLALMGMGACGRISRPVLAAAGSVLNYGYLGGGPQVHGQWPAADLRRFIDELLSDRPPQTAEACVKSWLASPVASSAGVFCS